MTFEAILDQAIAMLQRRGRLTYSTRQRQFQLDAAALAALAAERLYSPPHVVDDVGRGLVWAGATGPPCDLTPSPGPPLSAESSPGQTVQAVPPPGAPRSAAAERRQLTVLCIDIVASTALSSQLDPEDLREVIQAYQQVCSDIIKRFDGHVAPLLGDGLLVYCGYPVAHEDAPHRAGRTGLGLLAAMGNLNPRLQPTQGIQLAVRIGIHTGLGVVGALGGAERQEQLAWGETPNIAARLQGLAPSTPVAISDAPYRLLQGYVACEA